jgi:UDP-N-acetylmuramoyl-L-alanyl-D-glutamate--2,6-diaminopimelate ligase
MTLVELLTQLSAMVPLAGHESLAPPAGARRVQAVDYDSRRVGAGAVFVAVRGDRFDGADFASQAIARGAVAVIAERPAPPDAGVPWLSTPDARRALAAAAVVLFGRPSEGLETVGITGTNGKTTTTYLLCHMLEQAGWRTGRLGTVTYRIGDRERSASRTTPEAPDLQRLLREMADEGCVACVMEVSSHALALRRVDFMRFSGAVFTNLTRDHLDFHHGMQEYFLAKRRLFEMLPEGAPAAVNVDDPYGAQIARDFREVWTYALDRPAAVSPVSLTLTLQGISTELRTPNGALHLRSPLLGRPNAYNLLAAVAMALALGVPASAIEAAAATVPQVPGRFQLVSHPDDAVTVIVDYAHTDDALKNLLETARPLARGRMVTVFGCGGDRDRTKRPLMGAVAARLSDRVVLTSDNPRSEDPDAIIDEIKKGLVPPERPLVHNGHPVAPVKTTPWTAIPDRRAAITQAIAEAGAGDLVVIAGKGHEKYQEVGGRTVPFDDVVVARDALAARRAVTATDTEPRQ